MAKWRLTLDVPYSFPIQQGVSKTRHASEFSPNEAGCNNIWQCPVTKVVMLKPSFLSSDWANDLVGLSTATYNYKPDFWAIIRRDQNASGGTGSGGMMTTVQPATYPPASLAMSDPPSILLFNLEAGVSDFLVWAMESVFSLVDDESFVVHYHGMTDEFSRKNNWFAVQWDDCFIHFSQQGDVSVNQYNDITMPDGGGFKLIDRFKIGTPGDFMNKTGYFVFMPIPGYGLAMYHYAMAQSNPAQITSVRASSCKGYLIKWPAKPSGATSYLFASSKIRFALNPFQLHILALQRMTFPVSGTYTDGTIDPGYKPSVNPTLLNPIALEAEKQTITAALMKPDLSAAWAHGTDRQGAVQCTLTTDNPKYTPFLLGYDLNWNPVFATRATTPLVLATSLYNTDGTHKTRNQAPDQFLGLEFTVDEYARFEGKVTAVLSSAAGVAIAERGDATFLLEYSLNNGMTWLTMEGGFAGGRPKDWKLTPYDDNFGFYYEVKFPLRGMWQRFYETHMFAEGSLDGLSVGDAINTVLGSSGMPPLASIPSIATSTMIPQSPDGKSWRFAPRAGDNMEKVLNDLCWFLHTQGHEWRMRFNWTTNHWILEEKPHDATAGATWTLTSKRADYNPAARKTFYLDTPQRLTLDVDPPEANIIIAEGLTQPDSHGMLIPSGPIVNYDSLYAPSSPDYAGRTKIVLFPLPPISTLIDSQKMARRLSDRITHRELSASVPLEYLHLGLFPNTHVLLKSAGGRTFLDGWVKRATVVIESNDLETQTLEVSTQWEGEVKK